MSSLLSPIKSIYILLSFIVISTSVFSQCDHTVRLTDTYGDGWNGGAITVSVNGIADPGTINSFVENMPALDSKYLRTSLKKITPNLDMTQIFSCESCGHTGAMEVPLTADFFWPRQ